ncbi:MAG: NAD+ kinase, partial [Desulfuromonas sp.]
PPPPPPFFALMRNMESPLLGVLCGTLFTAILLGHHRCCCRHGESGGYHPSRRNSLAFGANIGTCVTAFLASFGKPRLALRTAAIHVFFNIAGVLPWIGFVDELARLATAVSPVHHKLVGTARLAADAPRQIANANTLFNLINVGLFIGLAGPISTIANRLFPDRTPPEKVVLSPRYLDDGLVASPTLALHAARLEIGHLGEQVLKMMLMTQHAIEKGAVRMLLDVKKQDDVADLLHAEINAYLSQIGKQTLSDSESEEIFPDQPGQRQS